MAISPPLFTVFFLLSFLTSSVFGHSWVHCSDYDGVITGQDFDESKCNGYIREWQSKWRGGEFVFGTDRGTNHQAGGNNWCQSDFNPNIASMYDIANGYSYATWNYGETITLVWPAKNHANYGCDSDIPDTSMKLVYNPQVNPDSEPTGSTGWNLLIDWHKDCTPGTDGCGFQNCPKFCENTDKAPCFQQYTVSQTHFPTPGFYTLMWYWVFNSGSSPYTTCFEVYISDNNNNNPSPAIQPGSQPAVQPVVQPASQPPTNRPTVYIAPNIVIKNSHSNNLHWMALFVENEEIAIINLEIRDSYNGGSSDWISADSRDNWGDVHPFIFRNDLGRPYVLPLDIRLTAANGDKIVGLDIVTDINSGSQFDFGTNFQVSDV